jgi:hypothetical protein
LCSECAKLLQSVLNDKLEEVSTERDGYIAFEKAEKAKAKGRGRGKDDISQLEKRLEEVRLPP